MRISIDGPPLSGFDPQVAVEQFLQHRDYPIFSHMDESAATKKLMTDLSIFDLKKNNDCIQHHHKNYNRFSLFPQIT